MTPDSRASLPRKRAMTWSALIFRSAGGLSVTNIRPVFEVPPLPPVKAIDVSHRRIRHHDVHQLQHAAAHSLIGSILVGDNGPVDPAGILLREKPLGDRIYKYTVAAIVSRVTARVSGW